MALKHLITHKRSIERYALLNNIIIAQMWCNYLCYYRGNVDDNIHRNCFNTSAIAPRLKTISKITSNAKHINDTSRVRTHIARICKPYIRSYMYMPLNLRCLSR